MRRVFYLFTFLIVTFSSFANEINFVCVNNKNQYQFLYHTNQLEGNYGSWNYLSRKINQNYILYIKLFKMNNSIDLKKLQDSCKNLFGIEYKYLQAFDPEDWESNIYLISRENSSVIEGYGKFNIYCRSCLGNKKISYALVEFKDGLSDEKKIFSAVIKN